MLNVTTYGDLIEQEYGIKSTLLAPDTSSYVVELFKEQYQQAKEQIEWIHRRNRV
jgi:hypothetical protein